MHAWCINLCFRSLTLVLIHVCVMHLSMFLNPWLWCISWSPNSTYLHLDFYLLSWRWWPLWSGGVLYQWSLQPEKASQDQCLFKISVSCTWRLSGWKNRDEKLSWTSGKACLFHACPRIPEMRDPSKWKFLKRGIPQNRNFQNEGLPEKMANRWRRL